MDKFLWEKLKSKALKNNWPSCEWDKGKRGHIGFLIKENRKWSQVITTQYVATRLSNEEWVVASEKNIEETGYRLMGNVVGKYEICTSKVRSEDVKLQFPEPRNHYNDWKKKEPDLSRIKNQPEWLNRCNYGADWNWERKRLIKHEGYNPKTLKRCRCPSLNEQIEAAKKH